MKYNISSKEEIAVGSLILVKQSLARKEYIKLTKYLGSSYDEKLVLYAGEYNIPETTSTKNVFLVSKIFPNMPEEWILSFFTLHKLYLLESLEMVNKKL